MDIILIIIGFILYLFVSGLVGEATVPSMDGADKFGIGLLWPVILVLVVIALCSVGPVILGEKLVEKIRNKGRSK